MTLERYMQPVAIHLLHDERLILLDEDGNWYLWIGEADADPIGIPHRMAHYLMDCKEMQCLEPGQQMWFVLADLPVREPASTNPDVMGHGFPH